MLKPAKIIKICANCKGTKTTRIDTETWTERTPWTKNTTKTCEHHWILLGCDKRIPQHVVDLYNHNPSSKPLQEFKKHRFNNDHEAFMRWANGQ